MRIRSERPSSAEENLRTCGQHSISLSQYINYGSFWMLHSFSTIADWSFSPSSAELSRREFIWLATWKPSPILGRVLCFKSPHRLLAKLQMILEPLFNSVHSLHISAQRLGKHYLLEFGNKAFFFFFFVNKGKLNRMGMLLEK